MNDTKLMTLEARPEREDYLACEDAPAEAVETIEARFPELNNDLIRMASTGNTGSLTEWGRFIERLQSALRAPVREEGGALDDRLHNAISKLKDWVSLIQLRKNGGCVSGNPIVDCVNDLPVIIRELEAAELEIEGAFEALEDAALATREEAPAEAGEPEALRMAYKTGYQEGVEDSDGNFCRDACEEGWGKYLETLRAQPQAREDAQPVAWRCSREWPSDGLGKWQYHDGPPNPSHLARNVQALFLHPTPDPQPVGWLRAVDEEMVCAHLGVAEAEDSYETAKKKLASLIQWHIAVAMDPSIGGHLASDELRVAVSDIAAERQRQVDAEGWSADRDDGYADAELAKSAAAYTLSACGFSPDAARLMWPRSWSAHWWKPTTARRDLVKAGALIVAEIERLDRQALAALQAEQKGGA